MNYEKKYKEALERARQFSEHPLQEDSDSIVEYIFPELAESEDEKIRKALIKYFSEGMEYLSLIPYNKEQCISWLEKQNEQEPAWSEEDERLQQCLITDQEKCLEEVRNDKVGHSEIISDLKEMYRERIDWLKSLKDRVLPQPKQEWSEEDKEYINDLIGVFDGQQYQAHSDEEIVKWLKSIRLPYNKEWDENDEEMLRSIIATCEVAEQDRDSSPARHLFEMQANWLKTLRPQNRWKPSDEQMEVLLSEVTAWTKGCPKQIVLESLYNDLLKLKE